MSFCKVTSKFRAQVVPGANGFLMRLLLTAGLLSACTQISALAQDAATTAVQGSLLVPEAETYVIGDDIPLVWRFHNASSQPLAFMWEGCCRLNGKLTVTRDGQPVPAVAPGLALAHQFAKAERLDPGQSRDFQTLLSDWIALPGTGRYRIEGQYSGVLSNQFPQVPKSLALWRGQLQTAPSTAELLAVDDYLAQREARSRQRGLSLQLTGPTLLAPLDPASYTLRFLNLSQSSLLLDWPGAAQLWIVDASGRRLGSRRLATDAGPLNLPPGGQIERAFRLSAEDLAEAPFGTYRLFVDLPTAGPGQPRLPSAAADLRWEWSRAVLADVVTRAASGAGTGLRNPALKLLRVYLSSIGGELRGLEASSLPPGSAGLVKELILASCLKPILPLPGRVHFEIALSQDGAMAFKDSAVDRCLGTDSNPERFAERLRHLVRVRRHLGWTLELSVDPAPAMTLESVFSSTRALKEHQDDLAGPIAARALGRMGALTNFIVFQSSVLPANLVIKLRSGSPIPRIELARKLPDPSHPQLEARFAVEELKQVTFLGRSNGADLKSWLADGRLPNPQILVLAEPGLLWSGILEALAPAIDTGRPINLSQPNAEFQTPNAK